MAKKQISPFWDTIQERYEAAGGVSRPEVWGETPKPRRPKPPNAGIGPKPRPATTHDHDLRRRYEAGESLLAIARDLGTGKTSVRNAVVRAGGQLRDHQEALRTALRIELPAEQVAEIVRRYTAGESLVDLESSYGMGRSTLGRIVRENGGRIRNRSEAHGLAEKARRRIQDSDVPALRRRYESGESLTSIMKTTGLPRKSLTLAFQEAGVPLRTRAEAVRLTNTNREKK